MFNAVRVSLDGKVSGVRESQLLHTEDNLKQQIARSGRQGVEQTRLWQMSDSGRASSEKAAAGTACSIRLMRLESDVASGRVRLCFGVRKRLWRKPVQPGGQRLWQP